MHQISPLPLPGMWSDCTSLNHRRSVWSYDTAREMWAPVLWVTSRTLSNLFLLIFLSYSNQKCSKQGPFSISLSPRKKVMWIKAPKQPRKTCCMSKKYCSLGHWGIDIVWSILTSITINPYFLANQPPPQVSTVLHLITEIYAKVFPITYQAMPLKAGRVARGHKIA